MDYQQFINNKTHLGGEYGFSPVFMPDKLFDFQKSLVEWATLKGRAAIFADCGLGKTFMQIAWAENVAKKTNGRVLILTPLAVAFQTVKEGEKIGVEVIHRREGIEKSDRIVVTNYERLHHFRPSDFEGVVCDESSILKNFDGQIKADITEFMRKMKYRLLCTATAAPNDYIELGTSAEALGYMGYIDMLKTFFKSDNGTYAQGGGQNGARRFSKNPFGSAYRFRGHSQEHFWRWVCSWARAIRYPSDCGFSNDGFSLPPLNVKEHIVKASTLPDGFLFEVPAVGLAEQRNELKRTMEDRCEMAAKILNGTKDQSIAWCHLNGEGDLLEKLINGAVNVQGSDSEEKKEEAFKAFLSGDIRVIVSKPSIAGFGMNWQHCNRMTFFPSHSYEQYYQSVRRCWRFGQKKEVTVDLISTEGQSGVAANLKRKAEAAEEMFAHLVELMSNELKIQKRNEYTKKEEKPSWL